MNAIKRMKNYYDDIHLERDLSNYSYLPIFKDILESISISRVDNYPLTGTRKIDDNMLKALKQTEELLKEPNVDIYSLAIVIYEGYSGKMLPDYDKTKELYLKLYELSKDASIKKDVIDNWENYLAKIKKHYLRCAYNNRMDQLYKEGNFKGPLISHDEAYYDELFENERDK